MAEEVKEIRESELNIQNVIALYLISMVESRADLFTAIKMNSETPIHFKEFFLSFNKLYSISNTLLEKNTELKKDIREWFLECNIRDKRSKEVGIRLSEELQKFIDDESLFPIFEEMIIPPYALEEEDGN